MMKTDDPPGTRMRSLTLDEKISIKGELASKGLSRLAGMTMVDALNWYYRCFGKPASQFNNPKRWHKKSTLQRLGEQK